MKKINVITKLLLIFLLGVLLTKSAYKNENLRRLELAEKYGVKNLIIKEIEVDQKCEQCLKNNASETVSSPKEENKVFHICDVCSENVDFEEFGVKNLIIKESEVDQKCELCRKNNASETISSPKDENKVFHICDVCSENNIKLRNGDRVLIPEMNLNNSFIPEMNLNDGFIREMNLNDKLNVENMSIENENILIEFELIHKHIKTKENEITIGEIVEENPKDDIYKIKILDGKYTGKVVSMFSDEFIKPLSAIMPSENLCLCGNFFFNEKGCMRYNCETLICGECHKRYPKCPYCNLLRKGNSVKVKSSTLPLQDIYLFGKEEDSVFDLYGLIENVQIDENDLNDAIYKVKLALDYNWEQNQEGKVTLGSKLILEGETYTLFLNESQVETFKPNILPSGELLDANLQRLNEIIQGFDIQGFGTLVFFMQQSQNFNSGVGIIGTHFPNAMWNLFQSANQHQPHQNHHHHHQHHTIHDLQPHQVFQTETEDEFHDLPDLEYEFQHLSDLEVLNPQDDNQMQNQSETNENVDLMAIETLPQNHLITNDLSQQNPYPQREDFHSDSFADPQPQIYNLGITSTETTTHINEPQLNAQTNLQNSQISSQSTLDNSENASEKKTDED